MTAIIDAQGVTKTFGKATVLHGVDLMVAEGTVLALLGPNGAGKTTTVRILTTLLKPDAGVVRVAGHDVLREPDRVRGCIGVAGQSVTMDGQLTGLQNLRMIGRLYRFGRRDAEQRAVELIERFGLSDAARRPVKTYSGGMRRRLDLAASLVAAPRVLFLDEPTTGLDPESRATTWDVVRDLVRGGTTVLLTTQYIEEADQLAGMVTVIDHGRIVTTDTPAALKDALGTVRLDLMLARPEEAGRVPDLTAKALPVAVRDGVLSFPVPTGDVGLKEVAAIVDQLIREGVAVADYTIVHPTLEEAFLQLVEGN